MDKKLRENLNGSKVGTQHLSAAKLCQKSAESQKTSGKLSVRLRMLKLDIDNRSYLLEN